MNQSVSTHSRPKAAGAFGRSAFGGCGGVSTHSRPKAAGLANAMYSSLHKGFNTQPPEGGWDGKIQIESKKDMFQHTAARRRLALHQVGVPALSVFQHTAARRRLAKMEGLNHAATTSFNTQPPEGGWYAHFVYGHASLVVSTHSRPKAAGSRRHRQLQRQPVSTHSRPKAAGRCNALPKAQQQGFNTQPPEGGWKVTGLAAQDIPRFNTQPPEGGWTHGPARDHHPARFNTQPPEGGWTPSGEKLLHGVSFNTQPPEGGWG